MMGILLREDEEEEEEGVQEGVVVGWWNIPAFTAASQLPVSSKERINLVASSPSITGMNTSCTNQNQPPQISFPTPSLSLFHSYLLSSSNLVFYEVKYKIKKEKKTFL